MDTVLVPSAILPPIQPPPGLIACAGTTLVGRQNLRSLTTPPGTATHKPIPHADVIEALIETLGFRHLVVENDAYAVSPDGMRMFGVLPVNIVESGVRFCVGVRNSHDRSIRLSLTVGYQVFVCANMAFDGAFTPTLAKHTKNTNLIDVVSIACDRIQRGFEPLRRRLSVWQGYDLADDAARLILYRCFIERDGITLPRHLGPKAHQLYFHPEHDEFKPRTLWSLENSLTSAIGELDDIPRFQAAAEIVPFLQRFA